MPLSKSQVHWYGEKYKSKVKGGLDNRLRAAALYLEGSIKKSFPPGPLPSAPGKVPHTQRGASGILGSIVTERIGPFLYKVGSKFKPGQDSDGSHSYPWYLEFGTSKMEKRPWLRPAFKREKRILLKIIGRGSDIGI